MCRALADANMLCESFDSECTHLCNCMHAFVLLRMQVLSLLIPRALDLSVCPALDEHAGTHAHAHIHLLFLSLISMHFLFSRDSDPDADDLIGIFSVSIAQIIKDKKVRITFVCFTSKVPGGRLIGNLSLCWVTLSLRRCSLW